MILCAIALAAWFAWPQGVDARRMVDNFAAEQARIDAPKRETLLHRAVPASAFSQRASAAGWRSVAIWDGRLHGRDWVAVVWEKAGHRVVYGELDGPPLAAPAGFGRTGREGVLLYGSEGDLRNVVTWTVGDRPAVLSGADLPLGDLYDLAGGAARR